MADAVFRSCHACQDNRRDELDLARLRIGHTYLTHSYLLRNDDAPQCVGCNFSFNSIYWCRVLILHQQENYYSQHSLYDIFLKCACKEYFGVAYLKEIQLYNKI